MRACVRPSAAPTCAPSPALQNESAQATFNVINVCPFPLSFTMKFNGVPDHNLQNRPAFFCRPSEGTLAQVREWGGVTHWGHSLWSCGCSFAPPTFFLCGRRSYAGLAFYSMQSISLHRAAGACATDLTHFTHTAQPHGQGHILQNEVPAAPQRISLWLGLGWRRARHLCYFMT